MPRPKLSSLSSLLPAKGEATRPEPIGKPSELESLQASSLDTKLELYPKPNLPTPTPPTGQSSKQTSKHARSHDSIIASEATGSATIGHKDGPRSAVSFRMTESLQERLRHYAFENRRSKQDILDDALHDYLTRAGH